jgi:hypothetical protein
LQTEISVNEWAGEGAENEIGSPRGTLLRIGFGETGFEPTPSGTNCLEAHGNGLAVVILLSKTRETFKAY